jgi:GTP-binding protein
MFCFRCVGSNVRSLSTTIISIKPSPKLRISLVGRPNTGKSTLFNRLTGRNQAIVSNVPGTTRDHNIGYGQIAGLPLEVIDTGGLDDRGQIHVEVKRQVNNSIQSSDVILFLVDAKEGITVLDQHFAQWIRRRINPVKSQISSLNQPLLTNFDKRDVVLVANKTEGGHLSDRVLDALADSTRLGFGQPILISASMGEGMADLAEILIEIAKRKGLDGREEAVDNVEILGKIALEERVIQVAIMGRPNVGKSSFINAVLGHERVIVGPTPGLTR